MPLEDTRGCLLLILRFGDEVNFSAGFSGSTCWQSGSVNPVRLAARAIGSSYSTFHSTCFFGSDLGYLPAGFSAIIWLMGLLGHPTQSSKCRFCLRVFGDQPQPSGKSKVSHDDTTL